MSKSIFSSASISLFSLLSLSLQFALFLFPPEGVDLVGLFLFPDLLGVIVVIVVVDKVVLVAVAVEEVEADSSFVASVR
jgi:branched-subunit amino acid permease